MSRAELVAAALGIEIVKARGRRAWALCPFHDDHHADNFFIRTTGSYANTFHCFGCKASGSLGDLVLARRPEIARIPDARKRWTAVRAFIEKAGAGYEPPRLRTRFVELPAVLTRPRFTMPREVILDVPLEEWVTPARRYAAARGITQGEVSTYGLGYAVDARLAGRIVFPVRVAPQRAVGYSARSFCNAERKYLTPHESENADLDAMFGEHLWPSNLKERDQICVTEGAINAIACARATGYCASSISGSDVRAGHVIKLGTFARVLLLTDPDKAGDKAARQLQTALGRRADVVRVRLPTGKDAADLESAELRREIERATMHKDAL